MPQPPISPDSIREQLARILASPAFETAARSRALLSYVVERAVSNPGESLKEYAIGSEALGKGESFDPRSDPIVRAEASRLRGRLERYYANEGRTDPVEIILPKGAYVPRFEYRAAPDAVEPVTAPRVDAAPHNVISKDRSGRWNWLAAGILVGAVLASGIALLWEARNVNRTSESGLVQFDIELKAGGSLGSEVGPDMILSPDGKRIVYVTLDGQGVKHLNARELAQSQAVELPGTEGASDPFFSPEGRWVGFWAAGKLKKTPVEGGLPVVLCDAIDSLGATWGDDGFIIAALGGRTLTRIPASGGAPTVILDLGKDPATPLWPQFVPGTKQVIYTAVGFAGPNGARIEALSLSTGKRTLLASGGTFGRYLPNGFLTYINQGTLFAMRFDIDRMEGHGPAIPVIRGVSYSPVFGYAQVDFSRTGALVYRKNSGGEVVAAWLDGSEKSDTVLARPGRYLWPRLSPDGKRLALSVTESGVPGLSIYDTQADRMSRLPSPEGAYIPAWTLDGRFIVLGGGRGMSWLRADGTGKAQPLISSENIQIPVSFTPDGKRLAFHERSSATGFDLWTVPVETSSAGMTAGRPELFLASTAYETYPTFSPDGRWIAYGSNESLSWEVYVRAFPDNGTHVQVSVGGGRIPRWSPNGRELFYRTDDQRMMVAAYAAHEGAFSVVSLRQWSPRRLADTGVLANFDVSPEGRVLALVPALRPEERQTENHVTFLLNFFDEVRRTVTLVR